MDFSSFLTLVQTIIVLVLVIALANISLKFINKNMLKNNRLIKIVEKVALSNNTSIGIVEICGDYYLMSFTPSDNKILKELDKEEIENILKTMKEDKNILRMRDKN